MKSKRIGTLALTGVLSALAVVCLLLTATPLATIGTVALAAVCGIPQKLEERVSREDLEGISGFLRSIEGVRIAATLREIEGGCKVSVRAVPGLDAGAVCARFGGGGHKGAGGANMAMPIEAAAELVANALTNAREEL